MWHQPWPQRNQPSASQSSLPWQHAPRAAATFQPPAHPRISNLPTIQAAESPQAQHAPRLTHHVTQQSLFITVDESK